MHDHLVAEDHSKELFEQVKSLIEEEASHTPRATTSAIALVIGKTFLLEHLLNKDGEGPVEVLKNDKLCRMMDKFIVLFSPNVRNLVVSFKHRLRDKGYVLTFSF